MPAALRASRKNGICSTVFLEHAFRTDRYQIEVTFDADGSWSYVTDTTLVVRGDPEPFPHRAEQIRSQALACGVGHGQQHHVAEREHEASLTVANGVVRLVSSCIAP